MSLSLLYAVLLLLFCSCTINDRKINENNLRKRKYEHIDSTRISRIELLIADTSIIDPAHKETPHLISVGRGVGFVDSTGKPIFKPTQVINFTGTTKNNLTGIFNNYLDVPQDT